MGRAAKWFKGLLAFKTPQPDADPVRRPPSKKRWSFSKGRDRHKSQNSVVPGGFANDEEASRHAIAVAAATAAVAEAAVAAAQAAAVVVHLTGGGGGLDRPVACSDQNGGGYGTREDRAAVVIQSHFRAYLSRKALRALRALVRLQALVRGRIQRKQNADKLRQLQAIARAQARAAQSSAKPSRFSHTGRASPEKADQRSRKPTMSKRTGSRSSSKNSYDDKAPLLQQWMERRRGEAPSEHDGYSRTLTPDDEKDDKILEVDTGKPYTTPKRRNAPNPDQYVYSLSPSQSVEVDGSPFYTATNSPQYYYASSVDGSSKRGLNPFTPTKSDSSRSCLNGYADHPSYMAYTESAKAKARSLSAPKQRPQWERSSSVNRFSLQEHKCSTLQASFSMKAYPGSGRLDRLGMPVRDVSGFSGGLYHRY